MNFWEIFDTLVKESGLSYATLSTALNKKRQYFDSQKRRGGSPTVNNAAKYLNAIDYDLVIIKHNEAPEGSFVLGDQDTTPKQNIINKKLEHIKKEQEDLQKELNALLKDVRE